MWGEIEKLVVAQNNDLFDTVFVGLVAFNVFQAMLFFFDVARIAVV